jgi:hypothetical protein
LAAKDAGLSSTQIDYGERHIDEIGYIELLHLNTSDVNYGSVGNRKQPSIQLMTRAEQGNSQKRTNELQDSYDHQEPCVVREIARVLGKPTVQQEDFAGLIVLGAFFVGVVGAGMFLDGRRVLGGSLVLISCLVAFWAYGCVGGLWGWGW